MVWYTFGLFAENWQSSGPSSTNYDKTLILTNSNLKKFALSNLYTPLKPRLYENAEDRKNISQLKT